MGTVIAACGSQDSSAPEAPEDLGEAAAAMTVEYTSEVTGLASSRSFNHDQSEAVVSVNKDPDGKRVITVTYNDGTPPALCMPYCLELPKVHFTPGPTGTRYVQKGASQLGWSYSTDDGQTWTNRMVLTPPSHKR